MLKTISLVVMSLLLSTPQFHLSREEIKTDYDGDAIEDLYLANSSSNPVFVYNDFKDSYFDSLNVNHGMNLGTSCGSMSHSE